MEPRLARLVIYPCKSLDGVGVEQATVLRGAGLAGDREYCLVDEQGRWVNGKRTPRVHQIRLPPGPLDEEWLSAQLGMTVRLQRDTAGGFPDDDNATGPTLVSTASLREVGSWFGLDDLDEVRRRFRSNLEIDGVPAFWEDQLAGRSFLLGDVVIDGVNPCARCVVPSRDPLTGEVPEPDFARLFAQHRERTLPAWSDRRFFDHFYRLALNTRVPESEAGKVVRVGDRVTVR